MSKPVVVCLTASGLDIGTRAAGFLNAELHGRAGRAESKIRFEETGPHLRALFAAGRPIIGVCAAGVLIRALAPLIASKQDEPPVLALAEDGSSIVPLLGGHRGANAMARRLEQALGARAAITTAGDLRLGAPFDAPPTGWRLMNPGDAPAAMAAALAGEPMRNDGGGDPLALWRAPDEPASPLVLEVGAHRLTYRRQTLMVGVGCARGADPAEAIALVERSLEGFAGAPAGVFSLDLKADEAAVHAVARHLGVPARFFSAERLEAETPRLANPSEVVFAEVGCHGVAEAAALAAAGPGSLLVAPKRKTAMATCAVAEATGPIETLPGRRRGRLCVVGAGPGFAEGRTPEASRALAEAEELVGYGLYIDLLGPLAAGKPRADFPLGGEEARCRHALEEAGKGRDIALVCSGDGGIYAMGALVMELLDRPEEKGGVSAAARRAEIAMIPGVSALQTASARAGALLGHDFCAISLSDLLTPWQAIEARIEAAAKGDFVVAFYNPVSRRRRTQLARAKEILLAHRPAETPVLLARELGRPDERLLRRTLAGLSVDEVDMLTTVLVGSTASRVVEGGDRSAGAEGAWLYTPRGYAKKIDDR